MDLFKILGTIAINNKEANDALDETADKGEEAGGTLVTAFQKIGGAVATYFAVDKIVDFGYNLATTAAEVSAEASAFEQIMGDYSDEAAGKVGAIADEVGAVDTRLTPYMTSMTAKFKGLGYEVDEATDFAARGLTLAADASAFWDKSLVDSMGALNSFINGSYEGGEAIGIFANDTQMAAYAVESGLISETKAWADLDEATKQATRLEYAENMMAASGATGQAAKEAGQYANVQANLNEKWRQFKAQAGEPLLQNIVIPAMSKLNEIVDNLSVKFEDLKRWVSENKEELQNTATAISKVAEIAVYATGVFVAFKAGMAIQGIVQGFQKAQLAIALLSMEIGSANLAQAALNGTMTFGQTVVALLTGKLSLAAVAQGLVTKAQGALNAVMSANPIGIIITAIAALVAAFIYLWNNCEGFREFWINLWDGIKNVISVVVDWVKENWQSMLLFLVNPLAGIFKYCYEHFEGFRNFVDGVVNAVKTFFTNLWENIKTTFAAFAEWFNTAVQAVSDFFTGIWNGILGFITSVWEGIKFVIQFGINFIVALIKTAFNLITLPFQFIWQNCKEYVFAAWEWIKEKIGGAISAVSEKITAAKEFITEKFEAIKTTVSEKVTAIKNKVTSIFETIKTAISEKVTAIKDKITSIFETIKNTVSEKVTAIKNKVTSIFESIKTAVSEKITAVKDKVTSIFETVRTTISDKVTSAKNTVTSIFDTIKNKISNTVANIKNTVTTKFNEVKNALTGPIETAKETIGGIVDTIKGFFSGMNISFPNIKLPHFGISPSGWEIGDLLEGSIPSLSIEWYAKAMDSPLVMSNPTIFGYNPSTGKFMGGGEAGSEVVAGTGTLMGMIAKAVADQNAAVVYWLQKVFEVMAAYFPQLLEALDMDVWLDGDLVVGGIAPKMNTALGKIKKQEDRGRKE